MSKLFNVAENNITYHLQNIFKASELKQDSVTQKIRVTASDGKKYNTNFYSLNEYKKYRIVQDKNYISDFDELIAETKNVNNI